MRIQKKHNSFEIFQKLVQIQMQMGKSGLWNSSSRLSSSSCCRPMGELAIDQWEAGTHSRGQPTASNSQLCKRPRMESQSKIASQWSNLFTSFLRQAPSNNFPDALEGKNFEEIVWTNKSRVGNPVNRQILWNILIAQTDLVIHIISIEKNHLMKIWQQTKNTDII